MRRQQWIYSITGYIIISLFLFGCAEPGKPAEADEDPTISPSTAVTVPQPSANSDIKADRPQLERPNMVDERFELLSLVFRLAGHQEYSDADTEYQRNLVAEFGGYRQHSAVKYAAKLPLGYDAVFNFSVHILKSGEHFAFIEDIGSLVEDGRWTRQSAADFLALLNDFYTETGFAAFYQANINLYEAETQRFIDDIYSKIDLAWFGAYVNPENLRCVYSPSNTRHNYGATVNDALVYCAVSGDGSVVVHEYCHSFANPIALKWYEENSEFQKWCEDTIDPLKLPSYASGQTIAGEYLTRAYNTLYYTDHGYAPLPFLLAEKKQGFVYIEDVYAMITSYEKADLGDDKIESVLGVAYEMGEEQSFLIGSRVLRWRVLSFAEPLPVAAYPPTEVGNVFGSKTGDVLYVEDTTERNPFLLIDLGETTFQGKSGYRRYCRISLGE